MPEAESDEEVRAESNEERPRTYAADEKSANTLNRATTT